MERITIEWLLNLIGASPAPRDHARLIEIMKSIRDGEIANLTAQFSAVAAGLFALLIGFGTLIYRNVTDQIETGSVTSESETGTRVTRVFSSHDWKTLDFLVVAAMAVLGASLLAFLLWNRVRASRVEKSYSEAVALYFDLSREFI